MCLIGPPKWRSNMWGSHFFAQFSDSLARARGLSQSPFVGRGVMPSMDWSQESEFMFSYQNTIISNIRVGVETNLLILCSLRVPAGLLFSAGHSRVNTLIETIHFIFQWSKLVNSLWNLNDMFICPASQPLNDDDELMAMICCWSHSSKSQDFVVIVGWQKIELHTNTIIIIWWWEVTDVWSAMTEAGVWFSTEIIT